MKMQLMYQTTTNTRQVLIQNYKNIKRERKEKKKKKKVFTVVVK